MKYMHIIYMYIAISKLPYVNYNYSLVSSGVLTLSHLSFNGKIITIKMSFNCTETNEQHSGSINKKYLKEGSRFINRSYFKK